MTVPVEPQKAPEEGWPKVWEHLAPDLLLYGNWYCHAARIDGKLTFRRLDPSSVRFDAEGAWVRVGGSDVDAG